MANRWGKNETVTDFIFLGSKITVHDDYSREIKRHLLLGRKAMANLDRVLKCRDITLLTKSISQRYVFFFSSYVQMWELSYKEGWTLKNWCFRIVVLEKTLKSPLDSKEIKPVNPIRNQPWISIGRNDAETEAPILWPPGVKSWFLGKDPDAGKDWKQEKGMTENEMVGWHHWLNGHEFEQTLGDSKGQGSLAYYRSWGHRVGYDLVTEEYRRGISQTKKAFSQFSSGT